MNSRDSGCENYVASESPIVGTRLAPIRTATQVHLPPRQG